MIGGYSRWRTDSKRGQEMTKHELKLGMYLPELGLPIDESLAKAKEIGADCVWFNTLGPDGPSLSELDDAAVDRLGEQVAGHGLDIFLINVGNPFNRFTLPISNLTGWSTIRNFAATWPTLCVPCRLRRVWASARSTPLPLPGPENTRRPNPRGQCAG